MTARRPRQAGQTRPQPNEHAFSRHTSIDFPVVALGAAAGGLDTFRKLFTGLSASCGMAFVLIQQLDPKQKA
jgi:two-component system, chemotaxis family, CheB/CheR fusion protein